jgi:two-component system sensor histidine kinase HydH
MEEFGSLSPKIYWQSRMHMGKRAMRSPNDQSGRQFGSYLSPWLVVGAVVILLAVVMVLAVRNINREKVYMSQILSEKGAALMKSFEAGARTGMMGMMWGGNQVQTLLEETAQQPGILYLVVTDGKGRILADNDRAEIGKQFLDERSMKALEPATTVRWRLTNHEGGREAFEVYRYFRPFAGAEQSSMMMAPRQRGGPGMMMGRGEDWCFPSNPESGRQVIFVGLDVRPFEEARREDVRNTLITSGVLLILGFGGFLSLFWASNYRATRRQLQDTSAFANEVVSSLPVGLIATDRDGRITFLNEAAERITGLSFDAARGKNPEEVMASPWCELKDLLDRGGTVLEKEMECSFEGARTVPVSVSASRIMNEEGGFVGTILILRDLGEVRTLQEEIRRKERLAALGNLAAGVAHEIRNPLSSIKAFATYFGGKFPQGSEDRESAGIMIREVDRLNRVISELLEFARPSELRLRPTEMNELIRHSLRLIQQDAKTKKIEIRFAPAEGLPEVVVDHDRFTQALLNLYLNAIQAMDQGGVLSVSSSAVRNGEIRIQVVDTGGGIQVEDLGKIFDPYFTTKPRGTGLGLPIVHKIVEAHGGEIRVKSAVGKGTAFTILIPTSSRDQEQRGRHES